MIEISVMDGRVCLAERKKPSGNVLSRCDQQHVGWQVAISNGHELFVAGNHVELVVFQLVHMHNLLTIQFEDSKHKKEAEFDSEN